MAEQVRQQAEEEFYDPAQDPGTAGGGRPRPAAGELTDEEATALEDELVERLVVSRSGPAPREGVTDGHRRRASIEQPAKKAPAQKQHRRPRRPRAEARTAEAHASAAVGAPGRGPAKDGPAWRSRREAARQLLELTGREAEGVIGLEKTEDGWRSRSRSLEVRRIPDTTDVLALYELTVDEDGELDGYRRMRRYTRGAPGEGSG